MAWTNANRREYTFDLKVRVSENLIAFVVQGSIIDAIKMLREVYPTLGLAEAKKIAEEIREGY